jgi:DNA-binding XRE family transcriptional regulator
MPKPPPTPDDLKERKKRASEWKMFRRRHLFTQRRLADTVGISRRTVQQVENAHITPHLSTLVLFEKLKRKHAREKKWPKPITSNP